MNPSLKRALTALLLVLTLVVAAAMVAAWTMLPLDHTAIVIDGERFSLADLAGTHAVVFFVVAVAAVAFALFVAILAGLFGVGLGLVGVAFALAVAVGVLLLVASPFLLCIWLAWRLVRTRPARPMVQRA